MTSPALVTLGSHTFTPVKPRLPALFTFSRAFGGAEDDLARTLVVLAVLHLAHPSPPWKVPAGASIEGMGQVVADWLETNGCGTLASYNEADALAAAWLKAIAPPRQVDVDDAADFSAPPSASGSGGGSSSPATTSETEAAGLS